jgi:sec-independent protein translocase protein TatA
MEGALSPMHWLIVLLVIVLLFGGKKLPELGRGLGQAIRGFKSALHEGESGDAEDPSKPTSGNLKN